jgi:hypothetical protein
MSATVRRYEGIDKVRSEEITREVGESLLPALRTLPGFSGCYVFDEGEGVPALAYGSENFATRDEHNPEPIRRTVQGGFHESAAAW